MSNETAWHKATVVKHPEKDTRTKKKKKKKNKKKLGPGTAALANFPVINHFEFLIIVFLSS